jgi:hypothetical protein
MTDDSYVYNEVEVVLTGRKAAKEVKGSGRRVATKTHMLYEITPKNNDEGSWKRWVRITDLYQIVIDKE